MTLGLVVLFLWMVIAASIERARGPKLGEPPVRHSSKPTREQAINVLLDEVDEKIGINAFGYASERKGKLTIQLYPDYYKRLDRPSREFAKNEIRFQWARLGGSEVIFQGE